MDGAVHASSSLTNVLDGVSCLSGGACTAVGSSTRVGPADPGRGVERHGVVDGAESRTGTAYDNSLAAVSCASSTSCMAVGSATSPTGYLQNLAEAWNGTAWSVVATPDTSATFPNSLTGVSCTSATACTAVGSAAVSTGSVTVVETWNGAKWTIAPSPGGGRAARTAPWPPYPVPRPRRARRWAHRSTRPRAAEPGGVVERHVVDRGAGAGHDHHAAQHPGRCLVHLADGVHRGGRAYAPGGSAYRTLVETLAGGTWSIAATPDPTPGDGVLQSVACVVAGPCTAAGYATTSGGIQQGLVESGTSTWAASTTPEPGPYGNSLQGVSCVGGACVAAGSER